MDYGFSKEQELFRQEVRTLLADEPVRAAIGRLRGDDEPEPDVRPLYRELGRRGLLAPNWPTEYGGSGRGLVEAAIAAEELVRAGVPDTLHVNTIQIVGLFILMAGTPRQKAAHLPALARGERFASVLYTEPGCGSDLGSLATTARRDTDGDWRLSGVKVFSMKTHLADLGLCAARTGVPDSRYEGISLFLVDLHAPGVRRTLIRSIADEQFHRIELDDVRVPAGDLLGTENNGWPLLTQSLVVERTGLDYSLKAEQWLSAAGTVLTAGTEGVDVDDAVLEEIGRHGAEVAAGRLLTWQVIIGLAEDRIDEPAAAMAKLYNSELAQRIAVWSAARLPGSGGQRRLPTRAAAILESAYREAPGVTIAGGTSDMMLRIISPALDRLAAASC
jgi:alkylation response protein AidB-like acyl-CoA dehydrogenase